MICTVISWWLHLMGCVHYLSKAIDSLPKWRIKTLICKYNFMSHTLAIGIWLHYIDLKRNNFIAFLNDWNNILDPTKVLFDRNMGQLPDNFWQQLRGPFRPVNRVFTKIWSKSFLIDESWIISKSGYLLVNQIGRCTNQFMQLLKIRINIKYIYF